MTLLLDETFESGAPGTDLTNANTGYDNIFIGNTARGSARFASTVIAAGQSAHLTTDATGTHLELAKTFPAKNLLLQRLYLRVDAHAADLIVEQCQAAGVATQQVSLEAADHTIDLKDGFTAVASTITPYVLGEPFRLDLTVDVAAALQTLDLFVGGNVNGTTPDETVSGTYSGAAVDTVNHGLVLSRPNIDMYLDAIAVDDAVMPPPIVSATGVYVETASGLAVAHLYRETASGLVT